MTQIKIQFYIFSLLSLLPIFGFSQTETGLEPCTAKSLSHFTQTTDNIEFHVNCWTKFSYENDDCVFVVSEDFSKVVPKKESKVLCVIYLENTIQPKNFNAIRLFDDATFRKTYLKRIQLIYVYDIKNGFNEAFYEQADILKILQQNPRKGLNPLE